MKFLNIFIILAIMVCVASCSSEEPNGSEGFEKIVDKALLDNIATSSSVIEYQFIKKVEFTKDKATDKWKEVVSDKNSLNYSPSFGFPSRKAHNPIIFKDGKVHTEFYAPDGSHIYPLEFGILWLLYVKENHYSRGNQVFNFYLEGNFASESASFELDGKTFTIEQLTENRMVLSNQFPCYKIDGSISYYTKYLYFFELATGNSFDAGLDCLRNAGEVYDKMERLMVEHYGGNFIKHDYWGDQTKSISDMRKELPEQETYLLL